MAVTLLAPTPVQAQIVLPPPPTPAVVSSVDLIPSLTRQEPPGQVQLLKPTVEPFIPNSPFSYSILNSCVLYVRSRIPDLPKVRTPADLKPNTSAKPGTAVLLSGYLEPHIAFVEGVTGAGIYISETNFKHGKYTQRFLSWDDSHLRGFWEPKLSPPTP